jgi:hypothetical protein
MRKLTGLVLLFAFAVSAANNIGVETPPIDAHPQAPAYNELYWDDGIIDSGWAWYTGGNYWAVQFDDEKTGGLWGYVTQVGATTYAGWPDGTFQGAYLHIFSDSGGYPYEDLYREYLNITEGDVYNWMNVDPYLDLNTSVFYLAWEQFGNYPQTDSMAVDASAGTHNWTGYEGSWAPDSAYGDFMLRCYWQELGVTPSTWGQVKSLYQ